MEASARDSAEAIDREQAAMMDMGDLDNILAGINLSGRQGVNIFDSLGDSFREAFSAYTAANLLERALDGVVDAGKEAIETVADLNKEATSLIMATGADRSVVEQYMSDYNALGQELGFITSDISQAASDYLRQGHSMVDTNELIRDSLILSKVSQLETADSTKYLTSIMQAYKLEANEVIEVVDRLSAVDLSAAVEAGGIAEAMSKTAVSAQLAGVSIDQLIAMVSTVGEVSQAGMSEVGNAVRTIFARMKDVSDGNLSRIGDDGAIEDLSNIEGTLEAVGIQLRESNNEFRNMFTILDETANKWTEMSSVQKAAVAESYSGIRQSEKFNILMENWDKVRKYIEVSAQSSGVAEEKFDAYLDSIEARTNSLKASLENLATTTIPDELYVSILDIAKGLVDTAADTGILKNALIGLGTAGSLYGIQQLVGLAHNAAQGFADLSEAMNITKAGNIGATELQRLIDLTGGLSQSQMRLLLSTDALTDSQKIAILMSRNMSQAEAQAQLQAWGLATAQNEAAHASITLGSAMKGLAASMVSNPYLLITVGVTALVTAFTKYKQSVEEARQATIEAAEEAATLSDELSDLSNKYLELSEAVKTDESAKESLITTQQELLEKLGLEGERVDELISKYGSLSNAINQVTLDSLKQAQIDLIAGLDISRDDLIDKGKDNFIGTRNIINATGEGSAKAFEILGQAGIIDKGSYTSSGGSLSLLGDDTTEGILQNYKTLEDALKALRDSSAFTTQELADNPLYQKIYDRWNEMKESVEGYQSAIDNLNDNLAQQMMLTALQGMEIPDTQKSFEQFKQSVIDSAVASEQFIGSQREVEDAINGYLASTPQFAKFYGIIADSQTEAMEELAATVEWNKEQFSEAIQGYEDGYSRLIEAQKEWNETGSLSAGTFSELQENGLLEYLNFTAEGLSVNTGKLIENAEATKTKAISDLQAAMTSDLLAIAVGDTSKISETAQGVIAQLGNNAETAGNQALASVADWATLGETISQVMSDAGVKTITTDQRKQMSAIYEHYKDVATAVSEIDITTKSTELSASPSEVLKNEITALEKAAGAGTITYKEYLSERERLVEDYYKRGKISAEEYYAELGELAQAQVDYLDKVLVAVERRFDREIDGIQDVIDGLEKQNELLKKQKDIYDSTLDAIQDYLSSEKDKLDNQIQGIEDENDVIQNQIDKYDQLLNAVTLVFDEKREAIQIEIDAIDDRIEALQKENDEYQKQLELEKAKDALLKARQQRTKYLYAGEDRGFIYQTDTDAIVETEQNLSNLTFESTIDALEKEKELLNDIVEKLDESERKWQDIADAFDNQKAKDTAQDILGDDYTNVILGADSDVIAGIMNDYVNSEQKIEDNNSLIESIEEKKTLLDTLADKWNEISSAYDKGVNSQNAALLLGNAWQSIILADRQADYDNFKNAYLDIQSQIDNNQSLIDSYNEKIVYYEDLKAQWADIADVYQQSVDDQILAQEFGRDEELPILLARQENIENFRNAYVDAQEAMAKAAEDSARRQVEAAKLANGAGSPKIEKELDIPETPPVPDKYRIVDKDNKIIHDGFFSEGEASEYLFDHYRYNIGYKIQKYHTGLEKGVVGKNLSVSDEILLKMLRKGSGILEQDEVPAILQRDEVVLTKPQWTNLAKNLASTPIDYSHMFKGLNTSMPQNVVQKRDTNINQTFNITCPGVTSQQVINELERKLAPMGIRMHQDLHRR